jgi:nitronate monooxygenase
MNPYAIPSLQIGELEAKTPIVQGGMGVGISLSRLASAVAEQGGIGVISAIGLGSIHPNANISYDLANQEALRTEIRNARRLTNGVIGLNLMVACTDYEILLETAVEEKIDVVFLGAGLPIRLPASLTQSRLRTTKTKFVIIVSSARAAKLVFTSWSKNFQRIPDAVVVEGPLAGGHLGFKREQIEDPDYTLERILPEVLDAVQPFAQEYGIKIPVIAAGGIYTGEDIYRFMQMGASGVQMATRFVATTECDASPEFKQAYLDCRKQDIVIINSPVGLPGRAIRNKFLDEVLLGFKKTVSCQWQCLRTCDIDKAMYCIANALTNARKGLLECGFAFAGANAHRVDKIVSVRELINSLVQEYANAAMRNASPMSASSGLNG